MKKQPLYVVNGALASVVLCYALSLSRGDRGIVDWVVVSLVVAAIAWNVFGLSRRLHATGGVAAVWHVQRTVLFWILGALNTALLRPEDVGGWKNGLGWALLAIAAFDTGWLFVKERRVLAASAPPP